MKHAQNTSNRRKNRIAAVQFLYAWDNGQDTDLNKLWKLFLETQESPLENLTFARELATGAIEKIEEIDGLIKMHAQNWTFSRIAKTDLAILRMSIYELLHRKDIPPIVSIDEAIDLTKIFSDEDSKRFVNGVLDKIKAQITRPHRSAEGNQAE